MFIRVYTLLVLRLAARGFFDARTESYAEFTLDFRDAPIEPHLILVDATSC